ncbi:elongation factor 1-beta [Candidatus Woesearchaeota archaeon]|nr:elongation factor 1-beta [Candidatus Woesearchaeota archaeon]
MASVVITLKAMPDSPETDIERIKNNCVPLIKEFSHTDEVKCGIEPIAFGLKAVTFMFVMDESIGSTEKLEQQIRALDGISSIEVVDVRRAIG